VLVTNRNNSLVSDAPDNATVNRHSGICGSDNKIVIGVFSIIAPSSGQILKTAFRSRRDSLLCASRATCVNARVSRNKPISSFSPSARIFCAFASPFREVNVFAGPKIDRAGTRQMRLKPSRTQRNERECLNSTRDLKSSS